MKILALDTAMAACSVAVIDTAHDEPLAQAFVPMERGHAEALAPLVQEVMHEAGVSFSEIDRIVVTTGPGTFTGVRIGLSLARGIGLARNIPVIGIDTLTAIAANEPMHDVPVLVVADARNGEVYAASFGAARNVLRKPFVVSAALAVDSLPPSSIIMGTAAEAVIAASGRGDLVHSRGGDLPDAARFGRLGATAPLTGEMPAPLYLRAPDAKPQSAPLLKATSLAFEKVSAGATGLLASIHAEGFELPWTAQAFAELLAMPGTYAEVALELGEPVGFVMMRVAADEAEIISIATRPYAQRRGVGQALIDRQFTELVKQGIRNVFIEVAEANRPARALYAAVGFVEAGRRKKYYTLANGGRDDAIVMRRELCA
jgi:tRNA threonylcarbamoyladenosine biosynthesis protein TsaB